jgi:CubicO group peptidase (beta-lactamase class C family)
LQTPGAATLPQGMDGVVAAGIRAGVFPGAVVIVGTRDRLILAKGYGHLTWSPRSPAPTPDSTLYDLASLTKVVATTPAIMLLVDRGRVNLDAPVQAYLPSFTGPGKDAVTVRDLLTHQSGLRASLRLDSLTTDADGARSRVLAEPLRWPPHTRTEYSDLNAMLLGWIVEAVSGERLDRFVADSVLRPLGMTQTSYLPPRALRPRIAPVTLWHGNAIAGEVHDQNAARLGGVSGHAGLYATGGDLARYAQWYLNAGLTGSGAQLVAPGTVAQFTRQAARDRALGWEMRDPRSTDNTGARLSPATFGHTGYTGTSIWIDPARGLFIVILTNRVFAPRTRTSLSQLKQVRAHAADAAVAMLDLACGPQPRSKVAC